MSLCLEDCLALCELSELRDLVSQHPRCEERHRAALRLPERRACR